MEEKIYFKNSNDLKLCGILTKPKEKTTNCIILCHGITVDKDEGGIFTELAQKLAKNGFTAFRFDFRGHGESEGNSIDLTVTGEKKDLESVIKFLQSLGYKKFGIVAASFGAGAASLFTSEHQSIVKAICLWNPVIDYHSILKPELPWPKKNFGKEAMKKLKRKGFIEIGNRRFKIGREFFLNLRKLYPWQKLKKVNIPILFVHGNKDSYVPYNDSVKYSRIFKNAELITIKGAKHGFHVRKKDAEEADQATINFFLKTIKGNLR
ncbi:MAG: alpha/beta fold hydrolase [bacterium]